MRIQSTLIQRASGALGNVSASTNRYGLVLQSRKSPRNKPTQAQIKNRQAFIEAGRAWGNLSQEIRESWNWVATQRHYHNKIGNHIKLQGMNYFKAVYQKLKIADIRVDIIQSQPQTKGNYLKQLPIDWGVAGDPRYFTAYWKGYGFQYILFWTAQATNYTVRDYRKNQRHLAHGYRPNGGIAFDTVPVVSGINYFRYQMIANTGEESKVYQAEIQYGQGLENIKDSPAGPYGKAKIKPRDAEGLAWQVKPEKPDIQVKTILVK